MQAGAGKTHCAHESYANMIDQADSLLIHGSEFLYQFPATARPPRFFQVMHHPHAVGQCRRSLIWPAYQYACMERRTEGKELLHLVSIMQWTPKEASIWN